MGLADATPLSTGIQGLDEVLRGGFTPKRVYLVEGVPGSGKTTLAKSVYSDYFLIDDPRDPEEISQHFDKDKIVITDPHLSFKQNRETLTAKLREAGFPVHEIVLEERKDVLRARAKKENKLDRIEFINQYKVS